MHYNDIIINPPIIAHRGVSALAPENTIAAFKMAKECGLQWVELDVTLASCGELVVFHDDTLKRTTNATGNITDFTYDYLQTLDAGSWFSSEFAGEKIPTLKQVLCFLNEYQLAVDIEVKSYPGKEELLAKRVLEEIEHYACDKTSLFVTSFSIPILEQLRRQSDKIPLGLLLSAWKKDISRIYDALSLVSIGMDQALLTAERVRDLKSLARLVLAYTVNDAVRAKDLLSWGVDAIFSDCSREVLFPLGIV